MLTSDKSIVSRMGHIADQILETAQHLHALTDHELQVKSQLLRQAAKKGADLDGLLIEAFSVGWEAVRRVTGLHIYRVQIIGALCLHEGDVAEMRTGEGKTITSVLPVYLNALAGKGVHVITVNEYLAERDAESNGKVFNFLGLTVGLNTRSLSWQEKQEAFRQDITYSTNSEVGFDYLRDNMATKFERQVLREFNYAVIDEVDSMLIDEARTPLIIAGGELPLKPPYVLADFFAKTLSKEDDVEIDKETRQVFLTQTGVVKAEKKFKLAKLFQINNTVLYHSILNALKANFIFKNGVEYLVKDNEIVLIDQHTGRLMEGRTYSDGLHQALQAKEELELEDETVTMATITYQNFFRLYPKLSGMTGTAKTEEEEFIKIYNMRVIKVPTNQPVIRKDGIDMVFANVHAKMKKLMADVAYYHNREQPILLGTTSVEASELVARHLLKHDFKFKTINAKNHRFEAEIIKLAGQKKAITLATNMAGRGTDIKLGPGVAELGGLVVLAVERNEARRIDNQLRGRSGRQGDPGESRLYVAIDDDLIIRFGGKKLTKMFSKLKDDFLQSRLLSRSITNAQKKVEGMNFDQRKHILDYDNVLAQHREAIYSQRNQILRADNLRVMAKNMHFSAGYYLTKHFGYELNGEWFVDMKKLLAECENSLIFKNVINGPDLAKQTRRIIAKTLAEQMDLFFEYRVEDVPEEILVEVMRSIMISAIDNYWVYHIRNSQKLRSGIYLRSYAQNNPLHAYVQESAEMFNNMKLQIAFDVSKALAQVVIRDTDVAPNQDQEKIQVKLAG